MIQGGRPLEEPSDEENALYFALAQEAIQVLCATPLKFRL